MTLTPELMSQIESGTRTYWTSQVNSPEFQAITHGKEVGHRIADYVDERTTHFLQQHFSTGYEAATPGSARKRSMGDVWIRDGGIFNPVNVKAGLLDMNGQPNLVSMKKLLDYILNQQIDSYYLLIVKFRLGDPIDHRTVLVDMLDWLDFITYDAGPGQIMLRERDFFAAVGNGYEPPVRTITEKVRMLFSRFELGVDNLIRNRMKRVEAQRGKFDGFSEDSFVVDQSAIRFVP